MSAQDNLNEAQLGPYFHGTAARLKPGDHITPPGSNYDRWNLGGHAEDGMGDLDYDPNYTYAVAGNLHHAVSLADEAAQNRYRSGEKNALPHVYEVKPTGPHENDPHDFSPAGDTVRSAHPWQVVRRVSDAEAQRSVKDRMTELRKKNPPRDAEWHRQAAEILKGWG